LCWNPFRITIQFLQRFFVRIIESAYNGRSEKPSPSSLRDATSPERGRFCSTYRQIAKSSPFGGAAERSEAERVQPAESLCRLFPQRRAFAESGAANAVHRHDPSCEKASWENPQIFPTCKLKSKFR
jgi:hypothetical protein